LDVTIQAEILELLLNLCLEFDVGLVLITHDLGVVSQVTEKIMVMYAGEVIEQGPTKQIIEQPIHPYTQGLINALPQQTIPGQRLNQIRGVMPSLQDLPSGCAFHPRCEYREDICSSEKPSLVQYSDRQSACHLSQNFLDK